jgi:uncharacterized pyridoxamine 5'-phosphate oxidase family protein
LTRTIDITVEFLSDRESYIFGTLQDDKRECRFCLEMLEAEYRWRLSVLNQNCHYINIADFPSYARVSYETRMVFRYLENHFEALLQIVERITWDAGQVNIRDFEDD